MAQYAAFLRAINVPGREASSDALRSALEEIGFEDVATYRTTGNLVFEAEGAAGKVATRLERGLKKALGFEVPVFLRTAAEVRAIASNPPFDAKLVMGSKGKLQVALLAKKPTAAVRKKVSTGSTDQDRLAIKGKEVYWLPSGGLMDSDLGMDGVTKLVGSTTIRTMGTIERIAAKYFEK